jgi:hypothetical protein
MRAIALAIILAGFGVEMAIRGKDARNDMPPSVYAVAGIFFVAFLVCLITGK